ncbi:hypothetical protein ACJX0J_038172, partial [Zea mays]
EKIQCLFRIFKFVISILYLSSFEITLLSVTKDTRFAFAKKALGTNSLIYNLKDIIYKLVFLSASLQNNLELDWSSQTGVVITTAALILACLFAVITRGGNGEQVPAIH